MLNIQCCLTSFSVLSYVKGRENRRSRSCVYYRSTERGFNKVRLNFHNTCASCNHASSERYQLCNSWMLDDWNKTNKLAVSIDLDLKSKNLLNFIINIFTFILFLFYNILFYFYFITWLRLIAGLIALKKELWIYRKTARKMAYFIEGNLNIRPFYYVKFITRSLKHRHISKWMYVPCIKMN